MMTIAVVDDREVDRRNARNRIRRMLEGIDTDDVWRVVAVPPLPTVSTYPSWIAEEDVVVLLIDQRLDEQGGDTVDYTGHDILNLVHPRMYDLPVYYLTAVPGSVQQDHPRVRGIIDRRDLVRNSEQWVKEFIREGVRYREQVSRRMVRLSQLTDAVVGDTASISDREELEALRTEMHSALGGPPDEDLSLARVDLLHALRSEVERLELLVDRIETHLHGSNPE